MSYRRLAMAAGLFLACGAGSLAMTGRIGRTSSSADATPILERHVASIHLHGVRADDAISEIQKLAGVKIEARWDLLKKIDVHSNHLIWLDFDDISVGNLMHGFTGQLYGRARTADFEVKRGKIVIAPDLLKQSLCIYDVTDLERDISTSLRGDEELDLALGYFLQVPDFYGVLICVADATVDGVTPDQRPVYLSVLQTPDGQKQIAAFLPVLRKALPDGSGPSISRYRVRGSESRHEIIRAYDVRDLIDRAVATDRGYTRHGMWTNEGVEALACAVSHYGRLDSWLVSGQVYGCAGRLIVEQTPQVQEQVRQTLADIRAGKPVEGFRLIPR